MIRSARALLQALLARVVTSQASRCWLLNLMASGCSCCTRPCRPRAAWRSLRHLNARNIGEMERIALALGIETHVFRVNEPTDYSAAFASMRKAGAQALVISTSPKFYQDGAQLAALALEAGLPTIC